MYIRYFKAPEEKQVDAALRSTVKLITLQCTHDFETSVSFTYISYYDKSPKGIAEHTQSNINLTHNDTNMNKNGWILPTT